MSERLMTLVAGDSGTGKSLFMAMLPNCRFYDTDAGGGARAYEKRLKKNGSERIVCNSYPEVLEDLRQQQQRGLLKNFTTVVLDQVTRLQQEAKDRHNPQMVDDWNKSVEKANREWRRIRDFCSQMDFNLFIVAHMKNKWADGKAQGLEADGAKNLEGDVDIVIHLRETAQYPSQAWVKKWRRDPDDERGVVPRTFPWTLADFSAIDQTDALTRLREPVRMATAEQVEKVGKLLDVVKLPEEQVAKWKKNAGVDDFAEMTEAQILTGIARIEKLLAEATGAPKIAEGTKAKKAS